MKNIKRYEEMFESEKIPGGKSSGMTLEDIAKKHESKGGYRIKNMMGSLKKELEMGIEVEKEHTDSLEKAKEIAMDHLSENPNYYTKLIKSKLADEPKAIEIYRKLRKR
jgi:hypothetical protein